MKDYERADLADAIARKLPGERAVTQRQRVDGTVVLYGSVATGWKRAVICRGDGHAERAARYAADFDRA